MTAQLSVRSAGWTFGRVVSALDHDEGINDDIKYKYKSKRLFHVKD